MLFAFFFVQRVFVFVFLVKVMDTMISRHAKRLLKLRVDEIEVKARISNDNDGQGEVSTRTYWCRSRLLIGTTVDYLLVLPETIYWHRI